MDHMCFLGLTSSDRPGVDTVDGDVVRLPQLLCPDARQRLLGGLGRGVHGLPGDAEAGGRRRDEDDPAAPRDVRHDGLGQEYGPLDVGVKVSLVELLGDLVKVGVVAECGAVRKSRQYTLVNKKSSEIRGTEAGLAMMKNYWGGFINMETHLWIRISILPVVLRSRAARTSLGISETLLMSAWTATALTP